MPTTVDLPGLERLVDEGAQLVDVLAAAEYAEEHLPGAINIPLKELHSANASQLDRSKPVVVYCHDAL